MDRMLATAVEIDVPAGSAAEGARRATGVYVDGAIGTTARSTRPRRRLDGRR